MRAVLVFGLLTTAAPCAASGDEGWVLYPPSGYTQPQGPDGAAYINDLLGAYGDTFYAANANATRTPEALKDACVARLKAAVSQLSHTLNGFAFDISLSVVGAVPPNDGISCRIRAESDLDIKIEVKED